MKKSAGYACALALLGLIAGNASAQQGAETGVAQIHTWVKVGRKTCMLDHYHDGNGNGSSRNGYQNGYFINGGGIIATKSTTGVSNGAAVPVVAPNGTEIAQPSGIDS